MKTKETKETIDTVISFELYQNWKALKNWKEFPDPTNGYCIVREDFSEIEFKVEQVYKIEDNNFWVQLSLFKIHNTDWPFENIHKLNLKEGVEFIQPWGGFRISGVVDYTGACY